MWYLTLAPFLKPISRINGFPVVSVAEQIQRDEMEFGYALTTILCSNEFDCGSFSACLESKVVL